MNAYLLDTSALTPLVDASHAKHQHVTQAILSLAPAPIYASVIALAEMQYGFQLHERFQGVPLPNATLMMKQAQNFPHLDVTHHTAETYAELKAKLAKHYLPTKAREFRKRHVADWVDQFTGKTLAVDDNDIWVCAQALETNFVVVAGDKMERIRLAEPNLKHLLVG